MRRLASPLKTEFWDEDIGAAKAVIPNLLEAEGPEEKRKAKMETLKAPQRFSLFYILMLLVVTRQLEREESGWYISHRQVCMWLWFFGTTTNEPYVVTRV